MSVFTPVSEEQLQAWLANYTIGTLEHLQGIADGVQNSNFFVTTTLGHYVLTLIESVPRADLPFHLHLMAHLARHGLPVPAPVENRHNEYLGTLNARPAIIVARLGGAADDRPDHKRCTRAGQMLAGLHLAAQSYRRRQANPRDHAWRLACAQRLQAHLNAAERTTLALELDFQARCQYADLPHGAVHADLFRDNVLWQGEHISGVIDFYFAGYDAWLYDLAVMLNDWCLHADGSGALDEDAARALLQGYQQQRPLLATERAALPAMLRTAALRFWLSRLEDKHLPRPGALVSMHDPNAFHRILQHHQQQAPELF